MNSICKVLWTTLGYDGGTGIAKYNCQDYAEDLRRMYYVVHFDVYGSVN